VIRDSSSGFALNVDVPNANVCVILPKNAHDARDAACSGLDVDTIASSLSSSTEPPLGFGIVRFVDWTAMIVLVKANMQTQNSDAILSMISGTEDAMKENFPGLDVRAHGDAPSSRYDVMDIADTNVARYVIDVAAPPSHPKYAMSSSLTYIVAGRDSTYALTFNAPAHSGPALLRWGPSVASLPRDDNGLNAPRRRCASRGPQLTAETQLPSSTSIPLHAGEGRGPYSAGQQPSTMSEFGYWAQRPLLGAHTYSSVQVMKQVSPFWFTHLFATGT
jgi:hypothetical protein